MKKSIIFALVTLFFSASLFAETPVLTLKKATELAIENNTVLKLERLKLEKSKLQEQQALATAIPDLKLAYSHSRMDSFTTRYSMAALAPQNFNTILNNSYTQDYSLIKLSSQVVLGLHTIPVIQNASLASKIAQLDYENKKQSTLYQVTQAYYNLLKALKYKKLLDDSITNITALLNQTKNYYQVGMITKSNVLRVEARLKDIEGKNLEAEKLVNLASLNLNLQLGNDLATSLTLDNSINAVTSNSIVTNLPSQKEVLNLALNRPEMLSLASTKQALSTVVNITELSSLPVVVLTGAYGFYGDKDVFINNPYRDWMVAGAISWTLFDGFATPAKINEAKNNLAQLEKSIELKQNMVQMEVIEALLSLQTAVKSIETANLNLQFCAEDLSLNQERFKTGAGTNQDVLDSELNYQQAQTGLITAQFDYLLAEAKYKYVTGQL